MFVNLLNKYNKYCIIASQNINEIKDFYISHKVVTFPLSQVHRQICWLYYYFRSIKYADFKK